MKKSVLIAGLLILSAVFVFLCISFIDKSDKEMKPAQKSVVKLKMAHNLSTDSAMHEACLLFAKKVAEKTKNRVEIDIYPSQKLGNDHSMVESARIGDIDILLTPTAKMSVAVPSMQYADLPFLFPTREDAYALLDGKTGEMILDDLNSIGLLGVTFWENGFKHFTANEPLVKPEDFKGKKIRVMKSRIIMEQFKALGAEPVAIDFHETREALKDKVVDGQENPLVAIVNMGFHEVQSDLIISEHGYLPYVLSISKKTLEKLPVDIGEVLIQSAKELTPWERSETQKREKLFLETIKKAGVNIHVLTPQEKARFAEATKDVVKKYEDVIGSHIISKTQEYLHNKYKDEKSVVIGVDADLSMGGKTAGLAIKRGAELAAEEINAKGGLLGKKVVVIAKDNRAIATKGVQNIKEFIEDLGAVAIIGGKHSAVVSNEVQYIQDAKIPFISPWATVSEITDNGYEENYIFRVSLNDEYVANYLVKEILRKYKNPAVVVENSVWGRGVLKHINKHLSKKGLRNTEGIIINRGEYNFEKLFTKMKREGSDSIIMVLNSIEGTKFIQSMGENKFYLPVLSHWGIIGGDFFKTNKEHLKNIDLRFIQTFSFEGKHNEVANKLAASYINRYSKSSKKEISAPTGVVHAYDSMHLIALAIKNAESFEGFEIKKALENIASYKGALKTYSKPFRRDDHEALEESDIFSAKFSKNGFIERVKE